MTVLSTYDMDNMKLFLVLCLAHSCLAAALVSSLEVDLVEVVSRSELEGVHLLKFIFSKNSKNSDNFSKNYDKFR
jgi:hypothetical protein